VISIKKKPLVGIDIGSSVIKIGELIEKKNSFVLNSFGTYDLPAGVINEGNIYDYEIVANVISALFKKLKIKNTNVAVAVGGFSIIVKIVTLQAMTDKELQKIIHFEIEKDIPYDLSEVNVDYQIIEINPDFPDKMRVLVVAVKKEVISNYISLVTMAGLTPCLVDVDSFALQNNYERAYNPNKNNIVVLIDVGSSKTSVSILRGNIPFSITDVELGTSQINEEIINLTNCTQDEAILIKSGLDKEKLSATAVTDIKFQIISNWCFEIKKIIKFSCHASTSQFPDGQPSNEYTSNNLVSKSHASTSQFPDGQPSNEYTANNLVSKSHASISQLPDGQPSNGHNSSGQVFTAQNPFGQIFIGDIRKILISGGGSNIDEFRTLLSEQMEIDVETINSFKGLIIDKSRFDFSYLQQMAAHASVCLGLAQRKIGDK